ncbi:putative signal transducing protein [Mucilaginibacter gracilis]|uniref:Putative signal transducing protein n=1 Tax=Mucilaginibacter gracilis TaxID=423350 RepID=A0A495J2M6_9SPHI|nr:DUF2007 domain-containing protein [Mucilaginibacter gracilis]RKR83083.1 putative signal transducing protein [Mucilaginibacter gracilis]
MENEDQIVTFKTYYDPMLAHIVRTRLEDNGIACFIADENMGTIYPIYNAAIGGIKLKVFARDLEKCTAIVAEDNTLSIENLPADSEVICPHCGSNNVRYGAATGENTGWFANLFSAIKLDSYIDNNQWHCFNCGNDFEKAV